MKNMDKEKKNDTPVLSKKMMDEIVEGVNGALSSICEVPRPIICTIAVISLSKYFEKPVKLTIEDETEECK